MTEYEAIGIVVVALISLVGLFFTVGKPVINLTNSVAKITTLLEVYGDKIEVNTEAQKDYESKNTGSHRRIHERIDDTNKDLNDFKEDVAKTYCTKKECVK